MLYWLPALVYTKTTIYLGVGGHLYLDELLLSITIILKQL